MLIVARILGGATKLVYNITNPLICDSRNLDNISNALRYSRAAINVSDYKDALLKADEDDFIYLDPGALPDIALMIMTK